MGEAQLVRLMDVGDPCNGAHAGENALLADRVQSRRTTSNESWEAADVTTIML